MSERRVLLASRNAKKLVELQRILGPAADVELVGLGDVPEYPEAPETGATFAENALLKAREGVHYTGLPTVADDSGLAVDALNGMPGIFSHVGPASTATTRPTLTCCWPSSATYRTSGSVRRSSAPPRWCSPTAPST